MRDAIGFVAVGAGGAIGALLRYVITRWTIERFGTQLPWGTFGINISGSFLIGVVLQLTVMRPSMSPYVRLFLATGVLGGYTTFSSFAAEIVGLGRGGWGVAAAAYALASVVAGVVAAYAGMLAVRPFAAS